MVIQYTLGGVELPYPVKFPYHVNVEEILHDLILGLPYSVKYPYPVEFPYPVKFHNPVKASTRKSSYLSKGNNILMQKSSGLNYFWCVQTPFMK